MTVAAATTGAGGGFLAAAGPVGWALMGVSALSSILGGRKKRKEAKKAAKARMAMGRYNAAVARRNAQASFETLKAQAETQTLTRRELQAQQRMNVASRGGVEAGTDMMSLIQQRTLMQLDAIEMQRRASLALAAGEEEAEQIMMEAKTGAQITRSQGKAAEVQGYSQALGTLGSAFLNYGN
jgi:hypothetical protein|tara:strand:+ start:28 stop:573 length:546 start_codon:yes stop_codon:yes gene_type:complete